MDFHSTGLSNFLPLLKLEEKESALLSDRSLQLSILEKERMEKKLALQEVAELRSQLQTGKEKLIDYSAQLDSVGQQSVNQQTEIAAVRDIMI